MSRREVETFGILAIVTTALFFALSSDAFAEDRLPVDTYECMNDSELALFFEITGAYPVSIGSTSITVSIDGRIHSYELNAALMWCHVPVGDV